MIDNYDQKVIDKLADETPMGRIAKPEDIARVILFFSSSDSDFVNGQTLIVDGGRIIR
jgi:NAD(P)-dependent dehydrogenase (short-subunit alcohol dehydrogenase family)